MRLPAHPKILKNFFLKISSHVCRFSTNSQKSGFQTNYQRKIHQSISIFLAQISSSSSHRIIMGFSSKFLDITRMDFSLIISLKPTFLAIGTEPTYMGEYFKKKNFQNFGVRGQLHIQKSPILAIFELFKKIFTKMTLHKVRVIHQLSFDTKFIVVVPLDNEIQPLKVSGYPKKRKNLNSYKTQNVGPRAKKIGTSKSLLKGYLHTKN